MPLSPRQRAMFANMGKHQKKGKKAVTKGMAKYDKKHKVSKKTKAGSNKLLRLMGINFG